jgi:Ca-activated chloride channel family protein
MLHDDRLGRGMETLIGDLRNRYVLGFSPTNAVKDGRYHRLVVKLLPRKGLPKTSVHWKTGYYAAAN